jgi:hypothetical protein
MIGRYTETGTELAEIVHEALIGAWRRLRTWLDEDRAFGLWHWQRPRHGAPGAN